MCQYSNEFVFGGVIVPMSRSNIVKHQFAMGTKVNNPHPQIEINIFVQKPHVPVLINLHDLCIVSTILSVLSCSVVFKLCLSVKFCHYVAIVYTGFYY